MDIINRAWNFAKEKHKGMLDDEGLDYFEVHLVQVASAVEQYTSDNDLIAVALLHDTIEDTDTTYEELEKEFGKKIADLVQELTHEGEKDNYGYYFPNLKSQEAIMIKLCDRASNVSRMGAWTEERKQKYLKKTKFWKDGKDK